MADADMNLTELLERAAAAWPPKPAIIEDSTVFFLQTIGGESRVLAAELESLSCRPLPGGFVLSEQHHLRGTYFRALADWSRGRSDSHGMQGDEIISTAAKMQ